MLLSYAASSTWQKQLWVRSLEAVDIFPSSPSMYFKSSRIYFIWNILQSRDWSIVCYPLMYLVVPCLNYINGANIFGRMFQWRKCNFIWILLIQKSGISLVVGRSTPIYQANTMQAEKSIIYKFISVIMTYSTLTFLILFFSLKFITRL